MFSSSVWGIDVAELEQEEHDKAILQSHSRKDTTKQEKYTSEEMLMMQQMEIITGDEETRYIIVPGDTVTVIFHDRNDLNTGVYQVSATGDIYLPLAGTVTISGLNRKEARERINEVLGEYIRYSNAKIQINNAGRIMVLGAVNGPGMYNLQKNLTVMEAILFAGGYADGSELKSVVVMRGPVDKPVLVRVDLNKMVTKGDRTDNIFVKPGDIVFVPTTFVSNLETFFDRIYFYFLKWQGLGGQELIKAGEPFINPINKKK